MSFRTLRRRVALAAVGAMVVVTGATIASPAQAAVSCQVDLYEGLGQRQRFRREHQHHQHRRPADQLVADLDLAR